MNAWLSTETARRWWPRAAAAAAILAVGFVLGSNLGAAGAPDAPFPDMRVIHPEEYRALVDSGSPGVERLARELGSLESAYQFVRDRIAFDPTEPGAPPDETLAAGRASCLGKAALLTSLFRALGVPAGDVRVVTGQVVFSGSPLEHAWVDLHYGSLVLQLDATDLFGVHEFLAFPGDGYTRAFVQREVFCFNDRGFAAVSQLNRIRGRRP